LLKSLQDFKNKESTKKSNAALAVCAFWLRIGLCF